MAQNNNEEIDLGVVYDKIVALYNNFLVFLYGVYKFFLRSWWILLILIVGGAFLGHFTQSDERPRETSLLVQINGDGANYVYDAVNQLQAKIKERDTVLLKKLGFYKNEVYFLNSLEIEPVVNVLDIIDKTEKESNRNFEAIIDEAQYEDDLLKSEVFIPEYKMHRINLIMHYWSNQEYVDLFLDYLNDNSELSEVNDINKKNLKFRIDENYKSITYMDSIFTLYGKPVSEIKNDNKDRISLFDLNITNIHMLFEQKALLMEQTQKLELEYSNFDETVILMNKPLLSIEKSITDSKKIMYPLIFIVLFVLFSIVRFFFKKAKALSENRVS